MKKWINFPRTEGVTSRQAHADFPEGSYEREMGREGFFGPATHLYHKNPPTNWTSMEGPLRPRAFDTNLMKASGNSPMDADILMENAACKVRIWKTDVAMDHLYRNGDGDDVIFVHAGAGDLYCDFGHMAFRAGDYLLMPRGTMWRIEPTEPCHFLITEATNAHYQLPDKGIVGPHALFDEAMFDVPEINDKFKAQQTDDTWVIRIKREEMETKQTFPYNPLDAMGWKGNCLVVRINWRDIRPLMSARYHLPPSAHITFVAPAHVICTFAPRPIESDPGALKVPFFHDNVDFDEFIFYHKGEFFSRGNIHPGQTTFHPVGFTHGPHPKALKTGKNFARKETDEVAVMIDTRNPLHHTDKASAVEWVDYVDSWGAKGHK